VKKLGEGGTEGGGAQSALFKVNFQKRLGKGKREGGKIKREGQKSVDGRDKREVDHSLGGSRLWGSHLQEEGKPQEKLGREGGGEGSVS